MLKYIQDQDFGTIEQKPLLRQKKIFCMNQPLQNLVKSRSVSQILHEELITLQKSSARKKQRDDLINNDRSTSPLKPLEVTSTISTLPKITVTNTQTINTIKKKIRIFQPNQKHQENLDQWNSAYFQNKSFHSKSPSNSNLIKALQDSFNETRSQNILQSQLLKINRAESPKKRAWLQTEKNLRNILCQYILDEKISFNEIIPEKNRQTQDTEYMIDQLIMNYEILKQIFRYEKTISKILLKTQGLSRKIIHTFFKEIKPNCPNDITQFDNHFKLRKVINKQLIIAKFIIGNEPEYDHTIYKLMNRETLSPDQQNSLSTDELLLKACSTIRFDFDYLNKLNYFNINLQDQIKQKQAKVITNKLLLNGSLQEQTIISLDFDQPQSILSKLNDCERRLGKFQKISNQSRYQCLEAEAYLYYK